ncbi:MAG TPA: CmcI family methyltransferase [Candidatus Limnocylindrales bacterium]
MGPRPLSDDEQATVDAFHHVFYERMEDGRRSTLDLIWLGYRVVKCPFDLWAYQEIVVETRPTLIVECGTKFGGTSLFLASMFDLLGGRGRVLTIDIEPQPNLPVHPRIEYVVGSTVDPEVIARVHRAAAGQRTMVILDSGHYEPHVSAELRAYHDIVTPGCYLIVEDTNVNGHPVLPDFGPGPMEAVDGFLATTSRFVVDRDRERFMISLNPRGYLRRVRD